MKTEQLYDSWKRADANLYAALKAAAYPLAEGVKFDINRHTTLINAKLVLDILNRIDKNDEKLKEIQSVKG